MKTLYNVVPLKKQNEGPKKILTPANRKDLFAKSEYLTASDLFMRLLYDRRKI